MQHSFGLRAGSAVRPHRRLSFWRVLRDGLLRARPTLSAWVWRDRCVRKEFAPGAEAPEATTQ